MIEELLKRMMGGGQDHHIFSFTAEDSVDGLNAMFGQGAPPQERLKSADEMLLEARVIGLEAETKSIRQLVKMLTREIEQRSATIKEMRSDLDDLQNENSKIADQTAKAHRNLAGAQRALQEKHEFVESLKKILLFNNDDYAEAICKIREALGLDTAATSSPALADDSANTQQ